MNLTTKIITNRGSFVKMVDGLIFNETGGVRRTLRAADAKPH